MFADEEKDNVEESQDESADSSEEKDQGSTVDAGDEESEQTVLMEDRQEIEQALDEVESSGDGEWKDAGTNTPAASETPQPSSGGASQESANKAKVEASAPPVPPSEKPKSGGVGDFLANLGIEDEDTQKWVLIGGGVLIFLCCACSCVAIAASLFASSANF